MEGSHIQVLLLTLFYRHFPALIRAGHIYIAKPPLYRIDVPGQGKTRPPRKFYALDDAELDSILDRLRSEQLRDGSWSIGRFKGLGEMNPEQLKDTTMHPDTRRLSRLVLPSHDGTDATFTMLMGKGEAASRRAWMEEKGNSVEADV